MSRCSFLTDQPSSMKRRRPGSRATRDASAARRAGRSRSASAPGRWPKWCSQTRLTMTRAVSGLSLLAMARASSSRPLPSVNGLRGSPASTSRNCRGTAGPRLFGLPRRKTSGCTGCGASASTIACGGAPGCVALCFSTLLLQLAQLVAELAIALAASSVLVLLLEVLDRLLQRLQLLLVSEVGRRRLRRRQQRQLLRLDAAGEDAVERVVVLLRDRVELVIVAAGAGRRSAPAGRASPRRCGRR